MKITITKLPNVMFDQEGIGYNPKELIPTGRMTDWHRNFKGWQYVIGNRLIQVTV